MARLHVRWSGNWLGLVAAVALLDLLVAAVIFTGTPTKSPAETLQTYAYQIAFRLRQPDSAELAKMHLASGKASKAECVACHGSMLDSSVSLHRIHLSSELLLGLACRDCHRRVDVRARGNTVVIAWVDESVCKKCHSAFPGLDPTSAMQPQNFAEDCTVCHSGTSAPLHDQPYLSPIMSRRECPGCHGGRVLPWTPLHERPDWLLTHGPEAMRTGQESCFKCHDFGLKFCANCHKMRPPSHTPRELWLITHSSRARADTRTCFTCHQADFCKTCHVNHQSDWLKDHPAYVKASGSTRCLQCHSQSFCSSCHTNRPQ